MYIVVFIIIIVIIIISYKRQVSAHEFPSSRNSKQIIIIINRFV